VPAALTSICVGLAHVNTLVELKLSNNALGERAVHPLVDLLKSNRSIQVFKLNNNGLGPQGGADVAQALLDSAKHAKELNERSNLHVIICGRNRLEGSAALWGQVFVAYKDSLQKIKMVNNGFREPDMIALAQGLLECTDLRYLNFRDATMMQDVEDPSVDDGQEHAWTILANVFRKAKLLEFVDLSDCSLNVPGSLAIIRALAENKDSRLRTLIMENNDMNEGVYGVLQAVIGNCLSQLATLGIAWNEDLECDAVEAITEVIGKKGGQVIIEDEEDSEQQDMKKDLEKETVYVQPVTSTGLVPEADDLAERLAKLQIPPKN
jgi:Ran GTPase-activating protein 1